MPESSVNGVARTTRNVLVYNPETQRLENSKETIELGLEGNGGGEVGDQVKISGDSKRRDRLQEFYTKAKVEYDKAMKELDGSVDKEKAFKREPLKDSEGNEVLINGKSVQTAKLTGTGGSGKAYEAAILEEINALDDIISKLDEQKTAANTALKNAKNTDEYKKNGKQDPEYIRCQNEFNRIMGLVKQLEENKKELEDRLGAEKNPEPGTVRAQIEELITKVNTAGADLNKATKKVERKDNEGIRKAKKEERVANRDAEKIKNDKIKDIDGIEEKNLKEIDNNCKDYSPEKGHLPVLVPVKEAYNAYQEAVTKKNQAEEKLKKELKQELENVFKENAEAMLAEIEILPNVEGQDNSLMGKFERWVASKETDYDNKRTDFDTAHDNYTSTTNGSNETVSTASENDLEKARVLTNNANTVKTKMDEIYKKYKDDIEGAATAEASLNNAKNTAKDAVKTICVNSRAQAEQDYKNAPRDNAQYRKALENEINAKDPTIKAQDKRIKDIRLLGGSTVFKYPQHTQEAAEKYGNDMKDSFSFEGSDKVVITAKQVENGTWEAVYQDKNGNEVDMHQSLVQNKLVLVSPRQDKVNDDTEITTVEKTQEQIKQENETSLNNFDGQINNLNAQLSDGGTLSLQTVQELKAQIAALDDEKLTPEQKAKKQEMLAKIANLEASVKPAENNPVTETTTAVSSNNPVTETDQQSAVNNVVPPKYSNSSFVEQCKLDALFAEEKNKLDRFVKRINDSDANPKKTVDMIKNSKNPNAVPIRGSVTVESAGAAYTINNAVVKGDWGLLYTVQLVVEGCKVFAKIVDIKKGPDCNAEKTYYANKDYKNKKFPLNNDGTINQNVFTMLVSEKYQIGDAVQ